jgi:hypothetical protein
MFQYQWDQIGRSNVLKCVKGIIIIKAGGIHAIGEAALIVDQDTQVIVCVPKRYSVVSPYGIESFGTV